MIDSLYVPFGITNAIIPFPAGTSVSDVKIDNVSALYAILSDSAIVNLSGIPEGAHVVTLATDTGDMESVMELYNSAIFMTVEGDEQRAKIIRSQTVSFNESLYSSKIYIPSQSSKVFGGIILQRRNFDAIDFVPVSQMIDLGTFSGMAFDPTLSMRLKYTVPLPFDPARNNVTLRRYDGAWTTVEHDDATDRYIEFTPVPPGLYVAGIPKPIGLMGADMRGLPSQGIPTRHPGSARYGTN